ncbi:hypothetical protein LCGC14_0579360 [marine sediment metagenome]|uniref:DUF5675 domain-containing protein n=1 Tax=marine sediment metagenome TaxID=412755 RepID=A0A0F9U325_9ZZZZ
MDYYIKIDRYLYTTRTTIGRLYLPNQDGIASFCYTLEDTVRAYGIKVPGETALPEGIYRVNVTKSNRFKRLMPILYTETNGYEIKMGGIGFKGSRFHGGNTHKDTASCPLVAFNYINETRIQGTAEKSLTAKIQEYLLKGNVFVKITNLPQK